MRYVQTCGEDLELTPEGTHHVPEVGAQRPRGLVVLHDAVVVEDFPAAFTVAESRQPVRTLRVTVSPPFPGGCESLLILKSLTSFT